MTTRETGVEKLLAEMETATDREASRLYLAIHRLCKGKPEYQPVLLAAAWNVLTRRGINHNEA
jgi:hypothetical protein